jgi:hypothetical protein
MLFTSNSTSPVAAGRRTRRYRFVFADHARRDVAEKRRRQVADHVAEWMGGQIVREERCGNECIVVVELARPVLVANAERVATACPHYVADTFSTIG